MSSEDKAASVLPTCCLTIITVNSSTLIMSEQYALVFFTFLKYLEEICIHIYSDCSKQ